MGYIMAWDLVFDISYLRSAYSVLQLDKPFRFYIYSLSKIYYYKTSLSSKKQFNLYPQSHLYSQSHLYPQKYM